MRSILPTTLLLLAAASAAPAGTSPRLVWCDVDGDGRLDALALGADGAPHLLVNTGDGVLVDATQRAGLADLPTLVHAAWRDLDGDGAQDLVAVGARELLVRHGDGAGGFFARVEGVPHAGGAFVALEWLDLDGDGRHTAHLTTSGGDALFRVERGGRLAPLALPVELGPLEAPRVPAARIAPPSSESMTSGGVTSGSVSGGPFAAAAASGLCAATIVDSVLGGCMNASAVPALGSLMPLSIDFNVDAAGNVGMGTTTPAAKLDVVGDVHASGQLVSTAVGGAPLSVASSDLVADLNADLLDGLDASAFSQLGSEIDGGEILDGSITAADLAPGTIGVGQLGDESVGSAAIVDGSITQADLGLNSVDSAEIASGAVGTSELASDAVTNAKLATGAVDTTKVADGTLLNSDISGSAAIAGTKVVPFFGSQDITTAGSLGVGTSILEAPLHVFDGSAGSMTANSNSAAVFERSASSFVSVLSPEGISKGLLFGHPGNNASGGIVYDQASVASESMQFRTGGNSTRMTILSNGNVGIGTINPSGRLHVGGSSGDGAIVLPSSSIGPGEMFAEPGVASDKAANTTVSSVSVKAIAGRTISCPTSGFVFAIGSAGVKTGDFTAGTFVFSLSESATSHGPDQRILRVYDTNGQRMVIQGVFSVAAGSHTFYYVSHRGTSTSTMSVTSPSLTLLFVPTAYGTVDPEN